MNTRNTIITSLFLGLFAFFSLGLSGYLGNWSDWMYRYMPKKETVMRYADPRAYSWKTYAALLATGIGATAAWKYYQQQQKMKNPQTKNVNDDYAYLDYLIKEKEELDKLDNVGQSLYEKQKGMLHRIYDMSQYSDAQKIKKKGVDISRFIATLRTQEDNAKNTMIRGLLSIFDEDQATERERLGKLSLSALVKEYDQKNDDILKKKIESQKQSEEK